MRLHTELFDHRGHVFITLTSRNGVFEDTKRRAAHIEVKSMAVGIVDGVAQVFGHELKNKIRLVLTLRHAATQQLDDGAAGSASGENAKSLFEVETTAFNE